MQGGIETGIGGLVLEQEAVGPGLTPQGVPFTRLLAHAQGHGQAEALLEAAHHLGQPEGVAGRLARLQHQRVHPGGHGLRRGPQQLRRRQAVAGQVPVLVAQAAIAAVAAADIGKLQQTAHMHMPPLVPQTALVRQGPQFRPGQVEKQLAHFGPGKGGDGRGGS